MAVSKAMDLEKVREPHFQSMSEIYPKRCACGFSWPCDSPEIQLADEVERYQKWVNDLQAGMYINCVYCGHCYGPDDEVAASMQDALKEHVEQCPEHPMSVLKEEIASLQKEATSAESEINRLGQELAESAVKNEGLWEEVERWQKLYDAIPKHRLGMLANEFISSHNRMVMEWRALTARLQGALGFYADTKNYSIEGAPGHHILLPTCPAGFAIDGGKIARAALPKDEPTDPAS